MKAIIYEKYGAPDVLQITDSEKPVPKDNEILIKIHSVSLNSSDCEFLTAQPAYTRAWGLFKPKFKTLGSDISGTVESVGKDVKDFKPGDAVFGDLFGRWGGLAEYVTAPGKNIWLKPNSLFFDQAAALPQAAVVALQGIRDCKKIEPGAKVLINGAGGGSGSFAIQIAKMFGAEVTAVDNEFKQDFMLSVGADCVIDYQKTDFTKSDIAYDLILDYVARRSIFDYKRILKPGGNYVMIGGSVLSVLQVLLLSVWTRFFGNKKIKLLGHIQNTNDINSIIDFCKSGKIKPVIDKYFDLTETAEAFSYLIQGRVKGKVIINILSNK